RTATELLCCRSAAVAASARAEMGRGKKAHRRSSHYLADMISKRGLIVINIELCENEVVTMAGNGRLQPARSRVIAKAKWRIIKFYLRNSEKRQQCASMGKI
ncbi:unnamed protein product, partial [Nesidiocoris tenuis]